MSRLRSFGDCNEQYAAEKVKANDDKLSVIKDYAANLGTLTDNQAQTLVSRLKPISRHISFERSTSRCSRKCCLARRLPFFFSLTGGLASCWTCKWPLRFL